ncbi:MAG: hypothetical protein JNK87_11105 [Bryobacterales bacterium]|nr:hypothetical protein [Bryobacterales bacterium]
MMITGGVMASRDSKGMWHVPKEELVTRLQLLLQGKRLRIAKGMRHLDRLVRELESFQMKLSEKGKTQYGAAGESERDDLVMAMALACWRATWPQEWV